MVLLTVYSITYLNSLYIARMMLTYETILICHFPRFIIFILNSFVLSERLICLNQFCQTTIKEVQIYQYSGIFLFII